MGLIRFAAKVLLFMIALPALNLVVFTGGIWTGLGAAFLVGVVGFFVALGLLPLLATFGVFGALAAGTLGGQLGLRLYSFAVGTAIYALSISGVAWLLGGLALIGFWQTVFAGAILGLVNAVFASPTQRQ